jgi:hypothetical protein
MRSKKSIKLDISKSIQPIRQSRKGFNVYPINPFLMDVVVDIKDRTATIARGCQVVNKDGDWIANATIAQIREVDDEEFVKIYTTNLSYFFELSRAALKIIPLILKVIQKTAIGKDEILFSLEIAKETYHDMTGKKLGKTLYYTGIEDLLLKKFVAISPRAPGAYYLNPHLLFNGDRITFLREYQKSTRFKRTKEIISSIINQKSIPDLLNEAANAIDED